MRGLPSKILTIFSVGIVVLSLAFGFFAKTAGSAIPRSHALNGAKQSDGGDTNILLLGLDSRRANDGSDLPRKLLDLMHVGSSSSVGGYNTNTMILIHIPADGKKAVAVSIPRDDYVEVPGQSPKKIKEAYGYAKYMSESALYKQGVRNPQLEALSREAGRTASIQAISNLLQVPIDHFAEVNLVGFYDLANAVGGIQVCLNHAVNDTQYSGAVFPAGPQTITGVQALMFVRQRHGLPNGDLDRTHRQQAFITGVITKFRSQGIFGDIGKLFRIGIGVDRAISKHERPWSLAEEIRHHDQEIARRQRNAFRQTDCHQAGFDHAPCRIGGACDHDVGIALPHHHAAEIQRLAREPRRHRRRHRVAH